MDEMERAEVSELRATLLLFAIVMVLPLVLGYAFFAWP
jgi:cytochrome bd-type quinol oxidase subunit 2